MDYDKDKVDEVVLALMWLVLHEDGPVTRAWKGFDWDALDRLMKRALSPIQKAGLSLLCSRTRRWSCPRSCSRSILGESADRNPLTACPTSKSFEIPYLDGRERGRRHMMSVARGPAPQDYADAEICMRNARSQHPAELAHGLVAQLGVPPHPALPRQGGGR